MFNKNGTAEDRIQSALSIAWIYSQFEEPSNKTWVIDQIVRALSENEEAYKKWVAEYESKLSNGDCYKWDTGIAP